MYACICHAVTEDAVRACSGGGFGHVVAATRAGSGCGTCVVRLRGLLEQPCVPADDTAPVELVGAGRQARTVAA